MAETTISLASLTAEQGFEIAGAAADDYAGYSVSSAGDVNGDGIDDIIVGAPVNDPDGSSNAGSAYVIYGSADGLADIDLASLTAEQGFQISGAAADDWAGASVSSAGDVNGDGIDDIIVGSLYGDPDGSSNAGSAYVVYGSADGLADIDLASLTAEQGFEIAGAAAYDSAGYSVSGAGDVNGDGIDDIIVGAPYGDPDGSNNAGSAYVVYGSADGLAGIDLASLTAEQGFEIAGAAADDNAGYSVSGAGDVNGDGIDDIIVGAPFSDTSGRADAGVAYVIYGSADGLADVDLASLTAEQGFEIVGADGNDDAAFSVSSAGDVNGDGIDDIVVGALFAADGDSGAAYVVYGSADGLADVDLASLTAEQGFSISGAKDYSYTGVSVSSAGDVNGDGIDDVIVGASFQNGDSVSSGAAFVVYGVEGGLSDIDLANLTAAQGFEIAGVASYDNAGNSVSSAGDVNGDGYDDVLVGAPYSGAEASSDAGTAYVVYGFSTASAPVVEIGAPSATLVEDAVMLATAAVAVTGTDAEVDAEAMVADGWTETSEGVWEQADAYGTATFDEASGEIEYAVDNGSEAVQALGDGDSVEESFTVTYVNEEGDGAAEVTFTLNGADEVIDGTGSDDTLVGTAYDDRLSGFSGNDVLLGLAGADELLGDYGSDVASYAGSASAVTVDLGAGTASGGDAEGDTFDSIEGLTGSDFDDVLSGSTDSNVLSGGAGDDVLSGGSGGDTLYGGDGDDVLNGGRNTGVLEALYGGDGFDIASYAGSFDRVIVELGYQFYSFGEADGDSLDSIEGVIGSNYADSLGGDDGANYLDGGAANDFLQGYAGDDELRGGAGADTISGGDGSDVASYAGSASAVFVNLGAGTVSGGDADGDSLSSIEGLIGSSYDDILTGNGDANSLTGGQGADSLYGGEGADTLLGGNYADHLDGGLGADVMKGGAGNDTYVVDDAGDQVVEQANFGAHDLVEASASYTLGKFVEKLVLTGEAGIDGTGNGLANVVTGNTGDNALSGLAGDDTLRGNAGADVLDGGTGADTMFGGAGDDTYHVDDAGDVVSESSGGTAAGSDTVVSTIAYALGDKVENLTLAGSADIDGTGNDARNTLIGNDGANVLDGGLGSDVLTGGAGEDGFLFSTALGSSNIDTITDFTVGEDTILLDAAVFTALGLGEVSADDFAYLSQASGDEHLIYNGNNGRLFYDADGAGGADKVAIATLDNLAAITHDDFFVV